MDGVRGSSLEPVVSVVETRAFGTIASMGFGTLSATVWQRDRRLEQDQRATYDQGEWAMFTGVDCKGDGMDASRWAEVDAYISEVLIPADPVLDGALEASRDAGLPAINVAPNQGKLLHLLARIQGATSILEVGTLGGYSTIWLARALPPTGRLISLELDARHAEVARTNLERAGLTGVTSVLVGPAIGSLESLANDEAGPFDLVFIDADKPNNPEYFAWAVKLARPGSIIIVDNVIRNGAVADSDSEDPGILATRRLNEAMAADPRVSVTEVQTVGSKGYDGFALALVVGS